MYDFLRRPAWIVSHIVMASLIVLAVVLGFWQRSRYQEESARADRIARSIFPSSLNALISPASPERCAMILISICE